MSNELFRESNCVTPLECVETLLGYAGVVTGQDYKEIKLYCNTLKVTAERLKREKSDIERATTISLILGAIITVFNLAVIVTLCSQSR